jgi:hypothetical protein
MPMNRRDRRYEVPLTRVPAWIAFIATLLAAIALTGTVYLVVSADQPVMPMPKMHKVQVPNVSSAVDQAVDSAVKKALFPEAR